VNKPVHSSTTSTPRSFHGNENRYLGAVYHQPVAVESDFTLVTAMNRIVFEQVRQSPGVGDIVDSHHLNIGVAGCPQNQAADSSETIDSNLHFPLLRKLLFLF
jgi:hypothetical protein